MWVNAWGKLPRARPLRGSIISPRTAPDGWRRSAVSLNMRLASARRPTCVSTWTSQKLHRVNAPSGPNTPSSVSSVR